MLDRLPGESRRLLPNYLLYQACSSSVCYTSIFVVFYEQRLGLSLAMILALQSYSTGVRALLDLPFGALADRYSRRRCLMGSSFFVLSGASLLVVGSVPAIAWVAETCFALATALRSGADSALLFDALKERDRLDLYSASESRGQAMASIGSGAGAILGGLLAEGDLRLPYVASAAFAVATMMFASRLPESRAHDAAAVGPVQRLRNATRVALGSTQILWVMAIAVFAVVASHVYYYLQQPFLLELGIPVAFFGFLFAATKLVTALVAASAHRLDAQLGERGAVGAMAGVAALGLGAMAFAAGPLGALLLLSRGLLDGLWMPLTNIYLNRRVRSELRATTLSLQNVLSRLALALTLGMLGMTMARFGLAALLGAAALVAALLGLLLVVTCPRGAVAAGRDAEVKHAQ